MVLTIQWLSFIWMPSLTLPCTRARYSSTVICLETYTGFKDPNKIGIVCPFPINISIQCLTIGLHASIFFQFHRTQPKIPPVRAKHNGPISSIEILTLTNAPNLFIMAFLFQMLLTQNTLTTMFLVKGSIIEFFPAAFFNSCPPPPTPTPHHHKKKGGAGRGLICPLKDANAARRMIKALQQ